LKSSGTIRAHKRLHRLHRKEVNGVNCGETRLSQDEEIPIAKMIRAEVHNNKGYPSNMQAQIHHGREICNCFEMFCVGLGTESRPVSPFHGASRHVFGV
jgi:hypothetical protein